MRVVVGDVLAQHRLKLPARHDQDPVETFATDAADPALGMRFRTRRRDRRPDRPEPFRTEDLVESGREFLMTLAEQGQSHRILVRDRDTQGSRPPAGAGTPASSRSRVWVRPRRRDAGARSAAAGLAVGPHTSSGGGRGHDASAKRRRLDQERARPRQEPAECSQQDTIGRPQTRPTYLAPHPLQLTAQQQDLHFLRPLRTTKQNQQLEQTASDAVSEAQTLKQQTSTTHRPTLPARTTPGTSSLSTLSTGARPCRTPNEFLGP